MNMSKYLLKYKHKNVYSPFIVILVAITFNKNTHFTLKTLYSILNALLDTN